MAQPQNQITLFDPEDDETLHVSKAQRPVAVNSTANRHDKLSAVRCFNYRTQLCVAGRLVSQSLEAGNSAVLVLDKNAEEALDTLETLGFTLRQAVLERQLDIYYYKHGVRDRTFFRTDYEAIFDECLKERFAPVQHLVMIELNTLFANKVKDAVDNQMEDFCSVASCYDVGIWGLYSPASWLQSDFLTQQLPRHVGKRSLIQAKLEDSDGKMRLSKVRPGP